jgi:hypothetical protein
MMHLCRFAFRHNKEITMADDECVICFEPLATGEIGCATPCGHCYHLECWNGWEKSGRSQASSCPLCKARVTMFCKLYLSLRKMEVDDDEDSLSSLEDDESNVGEVVGEVDEEQKAEEAAPGLRRSVVDSERGTTNASEFMIDAEILAETKPRDDTKYRKKAKLMKARVKGLESSLKNKSLENESLSKVCKAAKNELVATKSQFEDQQQQFETRERTIEQLRVREANLLRENDKRCRELEYTVRERDESKKELDLSVQKHQQELQLLKQQLEKSCASSHVEAKQILKENKLLREQKDALLQALTKAQTGKAGASSSNILDHPNKQRAAVKQARMRDEMQQGWDKGFDESRQVRDNGAHRQSAVDTNRALSKGSTYAARLANATGKPSSKMSSVGMFQSIDNLPTLPHPTKFAISLSLDGPTKKAKVARTQSLVKNLPSASRQGTLAPFFYNNSKV